jgi:TolA-binding protein
MFGNLTLHAPSSRIKEVLFAQHPTMTDTSNSSNPSGVIAMKISRLAAAIVACALTSVIVSAQEIPAPDRSAMSMDRQLSQIQESMKEMQQQIEKLRQQSQLQKNLNEMQQQIDKLQATTDPQERQMLIQEHLQTMEEHIKMISGMREPEGDTRNRKMEAPQKVPGRMVGSSGMMYGPGGTGFRGGMIYGPPGYPGGMVGPGSMMGVPPGSTGVTRYK